MKFPWFTSGKSSKKDTEPLQKNKKKELKKTYKISSLPDNLQKIALLIQQNDKEINYLNKRIEISLTAKKELEEVFTKELNSINE